MIPRSNDDIPVVEYSKLSDKDKALFNDC
jgi:hypothetical protein